MKKILELLPKRVITDNCSPKAGPLMVRYYLTPCVFGLRLCIHHFLRSDNDRHYHDHPWSYISLIFKGGYWEHYPGHIEGNRHLEFDKFTWYSKWAIIQRPKEWKHWVQLARLKGLTKEYNLECWTLVLFYGARRDWGFWTENGWVKHDSYDCN